jgi:hypothetical protein
MSWAALGAVVEAVVEAVEAGEERDIAADLLGWIARSTTGFRPPPNAC